MLRFLVHRSDSQWLHVALITKTANGQEALDGEIRAFKVAWDPRPEYGDLRIYALTQALRAVTQTRR